MRKALLISSSILLLITLLSVLSTATPPSSYPLNYVNERMSLWDKLFHHPLKPLMVEDLWGGSCDEQGAILTNLDKSPDGYVVCPSSSSGTPLTGCRVYVYDSSFKPVRSGWYPGFTELKAGQSLHITSISPEVYWWKVTRCYESNIKCTSHFISKGCGAGGCAEDQAWIHRDCPEGYKGVTDKCVYISTCIGKTCEYSASAWGTCKSGEQQRTVTYTNCDKVIESKTCTTSSTGTTTPSDTSIPSYVGREKGIVIKAYLSRAEVHNGHVIGKVLLRNEGSVDMYMPWLFEMQIRKKGAPFTITLKNTGVCDSDHPENVHTMFKIPAGKEVNVELETPKLANGKYTVYFLSRRKCWADQTAWEKAHGDYFNVQPFPTHYAVADVCIGPTCKVSEMAHTGKAWIILLGAGVVILLAAAYFKEEAY